MQTKKITKFSAASLTAIALMVGGAGVAGAQDADTANTDSTEESTERDGNGRRHGKKAIVAEVLDITPEELAEQREGGATLADIAGDQVDEVVDALVANAEERMPPRSTPDASPKSRPMLALNSSKSASPSASKPESVATVKAVVMAAVETEAEIAAPRQDSLSRNEIPNVGVSPNRQQLKEPKPVPHPPQGTGFGLFRISDRGRSRGREF